MYRYTITTLQLCVAVFLKIVVVEVCSVCSHLSHEERNLFTDFYKGWIQIGGILAAKLISLHRNILPEDLAIVFLIQMSKP